MNEPASTRRLLLLPLIPLYRMGLALRTLRLDLGLEAVRRLRFPVVSVGNLSTGGAGKTPLTIALARALTARGVQVDVLSRGYGRLSQRVARVHPFGTAAEFGDEPLVIARETSVPVYVARQRYDAGLLAEAEAAAKEKAAAEESTKAEKAKTTEGAEAVQAVTANAPTPPGWKAPGWDDSSAPSAAAPAQTGAAAGTPAEAGSSHESSSRAAVVNTPGKPSPRLRAHLLDDGFQHRQLSRDVDILMLNQQDWRDWLLPAGNLREPLSAIRRAGVLAIPANEPELEADLCVWGWQGPIWRLRRKMDVPLVASPIAAFCGIARPNQFFAGIEATGLRIALRLAFPDHFAYSQEAVEELVASAEAHEAKAVVTTAKDLARLGKLAALFPPSMPLVIAQLRVEIEDEAAAVGWLIERLKRPG